MSTLDLRCSNGCDDGRFEALNAPLIVDSSGRYLKHDAGAATYVCARCQCIAIDLAGVAREMRRREESGPQALTCPGCGLEMLPPEDDPFAVLLECPSCETRFSGEEGLTRLHGGGNGAARDWD